MNWPEPISEVVEGPEGDPEFRIPAELELLDGRHEKISARIRRVNRGLFHVSSSVGIGINRKLELIYQGCRLEAEVVYCRQQQPDLFSVGIRLTYSDEADVRAEPRVRANSPALVTAAGSSKSIRARVVDMSHNGLGLMLSSALAVGTNVAVDFADSVAFGVVRHCSPESTDFRAGISLEEVIVSDDPNRSAAAHARSDMLRVAFKRSFYHRFRSRFKTVSKACLCSLAGHDIGWSTGPRGRAMLKCRRCERKF